MPVRVVAPLSAQYLKKKLVENGWAEDISPSDNFLFLSSFILVFPPSCCNQMIKLTGRNGDGIADPVTGKYLCPGCDRCERCQKLKTDKPVICRDRLEDEYDTWNVEEVIKFFQAVDIFRNPPEESRDAE